MDSVKHQLFEDLWKDLQLSLTLASSNRNLLDFLRPKRDVFPNPDQLFRRYSNLVDQQNFEQLFVELHKKLVADPGGYDIVLGFVQRKEYKWLWDRYTDKERIARETQRQCEKALKFGNVPSKPKFYIERANMMKSVKDAILSHTSTSSKLNIHGMNGIGKTNLVAACVRDPAILLAAKYKIYWIDLKNCKHSDSDLVEQMYVLYHKLLIDDNSPVEKPTCVQIMKNLLHTLFLRPAYDKAIIVLDNVQSTTAIKHFDVCNLLIISTEKFDLNEHNMLHVQLNDYFTKDETMLVFSQALKPLKALDFNENDQFNAVIDWCGGDPTMTVLCANVISERREELLSSPKGWKNFKEELCKRNSKIVSTRNLTIEFCLKNLEISLKEKYLDLAIFYKDVNIPASVLALLWDISGADVDEIMILLRDKSLIVRSYNDLFNCYVYGVHSVISNCLLNTRNPKQLQQMHQKLINAYKKKYIYYEKFIDDNYIYQYVAYHLDKAGMIEDFAIYRDLKFLEAKIRATGIADVMRDFELYFDEITRQSLDYENLVNALGSFVELYGQNLERFPDTSIVQSALQLPSDHLVHKLARELIDDDTLYFHWLSPKKSKYHIHQLSIKYDLKVACFAANSHNLLIGTENGEIQLWDHKYDGVVQEFKQHNGPVTYLQATEASFLSISQDGTVKVWKLDKNKSRRNSLAVNNSNNSENIPSPACIKQKNHQNFFGYNFSVDNSVTYEVVGDSLISADFCNDLVVAGSAKGRLMLWKQEEQQFENKLVDPIKSLQFSRNADLIYMTYQTDVLVYTTSGEFISKLCCKFEILSLHTLQYEDVDEFVAVQHQQVVKCTVAKENGAPMIRKEIIMCNEKEAKNMCTSMTDKYLVIGSDDDKIRMWDLQRKSVVEELNTQYGNVICLDATTNFEDNSVEILLTGYTDKSVKLWHINPGDNSLRQSQSVDAFAARWNPVINNFTIALARKNKLTIIDGMNSVDIDTADVVTAITDYQQQFAIGLKNGHVYLKGNQLKKIMNLKEEIVYLEAVDDMLVAASLSGTLFVYYKASPYKLQDGGKCAQNYIKKSFALSDKLIVVAERKVSYWNRHFDNVQVLYGGIEDYGASCIAPDGRLCITCGLTFLIFTFTTENNESQPVKKKSSNVLSACCFSSDNQFLALATQKGDIELWNANVNDYTLYSTFKLHQSPVLCLKFSQTFPSILFSLSEQMAWWNVKLATKTELSPSNRRSFRSRSNSTKKPPPLTNLLSLSELTFQPMLYKRGRENKSHLLSAIKLHGTQASQIVHSEDFKAFLSIDDVGNLYNIRVIDNEHDK